MLGRYPQNQYLPYELIEKDPLSFADADTLDREFRNHVAKENIGHSDIRDYWITLLITIVLGGISFFSLTSAIVKFGHALTLSPQSQAEVPGDVTRQALSQIK